MPQLDHEIVQHARLVRRIYRAVFGDPPDLTFHTVPGGDTVIVVGEWLWIFPAGIDDRWTVRVVVPPDDWFGKFTCFARLHGREAEKRTFTEAMIHLAALESHRRVHVALDGHPTLDNHEGG